MHDFPEDIQNISDQNDFNALLESASTVFDVEPKGNFSLD